MLGSDVFSTSVRTAPAAPEGGVPEWVPEGSLAHADFTTGQAWTENGGEVTTSEIVGTANTDNLMGPSEFVSGNVEADGYHFLDDGNGVPCLALIGELGSAILSGSTITILWESQQELSSNENEHLLVVGKIDGSEAVSMEVQANVDVARTVNFYSWIGEFFLVPGNANAGVGALNCVAFTLTNTRGEASLNGQAPEEGVLTEGDWPSSGYEVVVMRLALGSVLKSITVQPPLPDESGLAALSALA